MNNNKINISKPNISISELCQMLQLSRARYYQLIKSGFFPKPLTEERSKRPYYDADLQQKCIEAREKGIGADGSMLLFYSPRKLENVSKMRKKKLDPQVRELAETLESMGLSVSVKQVQAVLAELYPNGLENQDQGLIIRELFRFFKQKK
jgi:hypothetical protein